ncbi:hypothetical protein Taro_011124 [Colocasia esculenta]|uniref:Uncharacterized protein n=1 Tax=Colocasia esculenta TaxID=4460 RepID=A0A843U581_COLES|nr:hypothetical protein [Colocasia esculenta]
MTLVPVRLPDSSRPLMVENVAWDGYNRSASQRTCSEPFGNAFRAGKAGDLLGGTPQRNLTASDHGGHTMEVFEPSWRGRALR